MTECLTNEAAPKLSATFQSSCLPLLELVVVLSLIGLLSVILLPAVAGTRTNSKSAQCLNNLRRLISAWRMYAADNADQLPGRLVANNIDWSSSSENTNVALLTSPHNC